MTTRRLATITAILLTIPALLPLAWALATAFGVDLVAPTSSAPSADGFARVFSSGSFGRWIVNSLWVAGASTLLATLLCSLAGFALSSFRFRGRWLVVVILLATALLPPPVAVIGLFEMAASTGGIDTYWAALLPGAFSVFGVFLYVSAFRSTPAELLDAARLDGCGEFRAWWSIALPTVRPTTDAFVLLHFLGGWNALLWPAAILVSEPKQTLPVALSNLTAGATFEADPAATAAALTLAVLPVFALFVFTAGQLLGGDEAT